MTRHIAGRMEVKDEEGKTPEGTPRQSFEIWDDDPDILVRFYLDGYLAHEDSLRGARKVSLDLTTGGYARIDEGQPTDQARRNALGMFLVGPEYLSQLTPGTPSLYPPGTVYRGKPGSYIDKIVVDAATGYIALSQPLRGFGEPTLRIFYDLDEQVERAPAVTDLGGEVEEDNAALDGNTPAFGRSESYDYNPEAAAAAFGLSTLPQIAGLTLDTGLVFTTLGGDRQTSVHYFDADKREFTAQHIAEQLGPREAYGPKLVMGHLMAARVAEEGAYLDFLAPDLAGLKLIAAAFRPSLVL